jgi:nucleotide-binding universal stress UspA family protein
MYDRILVPLDGSSLSEQTLPYVRMLATALNSPVELLFVYEPEPVFYYPDVAHWQERAQEFHQHREDASHYLNPSADTLKAAGVGVTTNFLEPHRGGSQVPRNPVGDPVHHIIEIAQDQPNTLVVMCTHGRSGMGRWVMGSVTDKILHAIKTPLFIVRGKDEGSSTTDTNLESIIVPQDGSAIAERILPDAVNLSKALAIPIRLVSVIPSDQSHSYEEDHLRQVGERLVADGAHSSVAHVAHGDAAHAIVELTNEFPHALVAMTTHGRSGVGRWVMGSVADRVVRYAAGPVLVNRAG